MPASYLTADSIWNSFLNSNKRHLILTGAKGSGKTTLLKKLFPETIPGITTWAKPKEAVYLRDNLSKETAKIGVFDETIPGFGNQMVPVQEGFTSLGVTALENYANSDYEWISIDEIGYLESNCEAYLEALCNLFDKKRVVAVVRKQNLPFLLELCNRKDAFVIDLDNPIGNIGCVIMASDGYPEKYQKGFEITIPEDIRSSVYVAGAAIKDGKLVTSGGRVLGAVSTANNLEDAIKDAYSLVDKIHFENAYYRHDIGAKALLAKGE